MSDVDQSHGRDMKALRRLWGTLYRSIRWQATRSDQINDRVTRLERFVESPPGDWAVHRQTHEIVTRQLRGEIDGLRAEINMLRREIGGQDQPTRGDSGRARTEG